MSAAMSSRELGRSATVPWPSPPEGATSPLPPRQRRNSGDGARCRSCSAKMPSCSISSWRNAHRRPSASKRLVEERTAELHDAVGAARYLRQYGPRRRHVRQQLQLASWNRQFAEMLELPESFFARQLDLYRLSFDFWRERGEYGAVDVEGEVQRLYGRAGQHYAFERMRPTVQCSKSGTARCRTAGW